MEASEIMNLLPHRYPLLLVDRVTRIEDKSIEGVKCVTVNEPMFQGHFPGNPIFPGVYGVEALAQLSGIWCFSKLDLKSDDLVFLVSIDKCKFKKMILPGDKLTMKAENLKIFGSVEKGAMAKFKCSIEVDGKVATTCELMIGAKRNEG